MAAATKADGTAKDPTAKGPNLTAGQQIVAKWESDKIAEPCELAAMIDRALMAAIQNGYERGNEAGYSEGFQDGESKSWNTAYNSGYDNGYDEAQGDLDDEPVVLLVTP